MLITAKSPRELRFAELMQIYEQSNLETAEKHKDMPPMFALQLAEADFRQYLLEVFFRTVGAAYCIWEENGHYVSALRLEPYKDGLLLTALETAPAFRRQGYAEALIRAVQKNIADTGNRKIYSHVGKGNYASFCIHEKCGFRVISDCAAYINGSVDSRSYTLLYEC